MSFPNNTKSYKVLVRNTGKEWVKYQELPETLEIGNDKTSATFPAASLDTFISILTELKDAKDSSEVS